MLILFFKLFLKNYSLLRIFQIIEINKLLLNGKTLEFGAHKKKERNFSFYINEKKKLNYSNIFTDKKSNIFYADLTKKLKIKSNLYNNILIFNVLEHLNEHESTSKELNRILKKKWESCRIYSFFISNTWCSKRLFKIF